MPDAPARHDERHHPVIAVASPVVCLCLLRDPIGQRHTDYVPTATRDVAAHGLLAQSASGGAMVQDVCARKDRQQAVFLPQ